MRRVLASFILLTSMSSMLWAQDGAQPQAGALTDIKPEAQTAPRRVGVQKGLRQRKESEKYRSSRLTRDEFQTVTDKRTLSIAAGEDQTVDLDFDIDNIERDIKIANPQVVTATVGMIGDKPRQIIFTGLKAGDTTVTVRDPSGENGVIFSVAITASNLVKLKNELRALLRDVEGVDVKIVGQKVVVDGEVMVITDYERLFQVVNDKSYADRVINLTTLSPLTLLTMAKKIEEDVKTFAPNVKARPVNGMIFLEGTVDSADQSKRALEVAKLYLPEVTLGSPLDNSKDTPVKKISRAMVQNFILINPPPPKKEDKLIRVTVHFVELSKGYNKVFGFRWAPGFVSDPTVNIGTNENGGVGTGGASFSATLSSLFPKLRSAQNAGYARILRTATVIVKSKEAASFRSGRSVPFIIPPTVAGAAATVQKQNIDFKVKVNPKILGQSDDIEMQVDLSQSVASGTGQQGIPETTDSEVSTKLYVKSMESAAISSFSSYDVTNNFNQDPPGGSSSTGSEIFELLRSKNYKKARKQFVVFVTPQIVESAAEGSEEAKKNFRIKVR